MEKTLYSLDDLLWVMRRLRDPATGCPWDLRQSFSSIVPSTLEECYELAQAIEDEDYQHIGEELGDVLFQVIFYAQLGMEQNLFSFQTIVSVLVEKLLRRHPHVFPAGDIKGIALEGSSIEEVKSSWEKIKQDERNSKRQTGVLADVPIALPALTRAQKIQKRASQVDFDWPHASFVFGKLAEELDELREAVAESDSDAIHDEMGDVLFTCVNLARHLGVDAESSLRHAIRKFERRFSAMESAAQCNGEDFSSLSAAQRDILWRQAKDL